MGRLNKLIKELCPNGVEYRTLGELGKFYGGLTGKSKSDFFDGNSAFITYKNVYSNPALNINPDDTVRITEDENQHVLKYGDVVFTGSSETPDECGFSSVVTKKPEKSLYLNSFCFFYRFKDTDLVRPDFAKHLFRSQNLRYQIGKTASGVTRFNVSKDKMKKVTIPIPPLQVQEEIVRILDNFTELTAELTVELTARKKQYEYYRDCLLTFGDEVEWKALGGITSLSRGVRVIRSQLSDQGEYPVYQNSMTPLGYYDKSNYQAKTTFIISAGAAGSVGYSDVDFWAADDCYCLVYPENLNSRYLYHALSNQQDYIFSQVRRASVPRIGRDVVERIKIPIPYPQDVKKSLAEQQRIVDILDRFDTLCNDISTGLPAEIKARQQQYEYYRNKLLTFKKIDAEV